MLDNRSEKCKAAHLCLLVTFVHLSFCPPVQVNAQLIPFSVTVVLYSLKLRKIQKPLTGLDNLRVCTFCSHAFNNSVWKVKRGN